MTDTTDTGLELVVPGTEEVIALRDASALELADLLEDLDELKARAGDARAAVVGELARRADARGARTVSIGGIDYAVNAPTSEAYDRRRLEEELAPLVEDGTLDAAILTEVIRHPPRPPAPEPEVDLRVVNRLKKSDDKRVLAALAAARTVSPNRRTVKIKASATDTTAEELDA